MRKRIAFTLLIVTILVGSSIIYAEECNSLDAEGVVIELMENSADFKSAIDAWDNASDQLFKAQRQPYDYLNPLSSEYQLNTAQRQVDIVQNSIIYKGYSMYANVLKAKYEVDLQVLVLEQANLSYKNTLLKVELGKASTEQLETSKGQYQIEKLGLQIKERELKGLIASLNALMGRSPKMEYKHFVDHNLKASLEINSEEYYVNQALANRGEILNTTEQLEVKILQRDRSFNPNLLHINPRYIQLKQEIEILENEREMNLINVEIEILGLYDELKTAISNLENAKEEIIEAQNNLKETEQKYKMGLISNFDKKEERLAYSKVEYKLDKVQLDTWLIQVKINFASGVGL